MKLYAMRMLQVMDATNFSKPGFHFPAFIAGLEKADISALFLENIMTLGSVHADSGTKGGSLQGPVKAQTAEGATREQVMERNITAWVEASRQAGMSGHYQRSAGIPEEVTMEASRFADLLLLSPVLSFQSVDKVAPTTFAEDILARAQCPVLVLPNRMEEIAEVIFTYNGGYSSVYAIRQFTLLFPSLRNRKITVLYFPENKSRIENDQHSLEAYLGMHYAAFDFKILSGSSASTAILEYLFRKKNCIVTFGAYGRSKMSQFFKKSTLENILKSVDIPVFVTHP